MNKTINILVVLTFIWFSLSIPGIMPLINSSGVKSIDAILWIVFLILMLYYFSKEKFSKISLTIFFALFALLEFNTIVKYVFFKANESVILKYNEMFYGTIYIVEKSSQRLIPNAYHIVLIVLIIFTLVFSLIMDIIMWSRRR